MAAKLLVIDNYDSFTYNLVQMFRQFPLDVKVLRSDKIALEGVDFLAPDYILISPGPKDPEHAGVCVELIRAWYRKVPIIGVCLGMQCINEVFGGRTFWFDDDLQTVSLRLFDGMLEVLFAAWLTADLPPGFSPVLDVDGEETELPRLTTGNCLSLAIRVGSQVYC